MTYRYLLRDADLVSDVELTEEDGYKFGTTSTDLKNGLYIKVTPEHAIWHNEHRNATIYELCDMRMSGELMSRTVRMDSTEDIKAALELAECKVRLLDYMCQVFYINNIGGWFNKNQRSAIMNDIQSTQALKNTTYDFYISGNKITVPIETAKKFMYELEDYSKQTYVKALENTENLRKLNSVEEINNYNIKLDFPKPLSFTV